jgi:hypothetical protein
MENWLDRVVARPLIGIQTLPDVTRSMLVQVLSPVLTQHHGNVDVSLGLAGIVEFKLVNGFTLRLTPTDVIVQFDYKTTWESSAGKLKTPVVPEVRPYTELLTQALSITSAVVGAMLASSGGSQTSVARVGIVAIADLDPDNLVPGVDLLTTHLGAPWRQRRLAAANATLLANLDEDNEHVERCHHGLVFDQAQPENGLKLTLDWQRAYLPTLPEPRKRFQGELDACRDRALAYFQKIGEGELFDDAAD